MATGAMVQNTLPARKTVFASSAILSIQRQSIVFFLNKIIRQKLFSVHVGTDALKKKNLDTGKKENCYRERINAPCMGFILKKKRKEKKPWTSWQREKIISESSKTLTVLWAAALKETHSRLH